MRKAHALLLWPSLCLLAACASAPQTPQARRLQAADLALAIKKTAPKTSDEAARIVSQIAVEASAQLRERYHIQLNHNLHNLLVYWGLKKRGFCWHWQVDLQSALADGLPATLQVRRIWAYPGSLFHEHHALVLVPTGEDWHGGLVLDAWRDEGRLWFGPVKTDDYPWLEE